MFVLSVHISKKKILIYLVAFVMVALLAFASFSTNNPKALAATSSKKYSIDASDNKQRVEFLESYGWQINPEPIEICDIKIPTVFNEVYENYNQIQKEQGLDLKKYMGKACKRFSYDVTNYPGDTGEVRANILVIEDKLVAGDISSIELNGFMHGFEKKN